MCMKSSLSTEGFWQPVINMLSPFPSTAVATHFFHSFPAVLAALKAQSFYSQYRRNSITKSSFPTPLSPLCRLRASVVSSVALFVYETCLVIYALFLPCLAGVHARDHCHYLYTLPGI